MGTLSTKAEARSNSFKLPKSSWITTTERDYSFYFSGKDVEEVESKLREALDVITCCLVTLRDEISAQK